MSHGKTAMLKGSTVKPIDIGGKPSYFYGEAEIGTVATHGFSSGNASKATPEVVNEINIKIASAWKKAKQKDDAPEVTASDVTFEVYTKR